MNTLNRVISIIGLTTIVAFLLVLTGAISLPYFLEASSGLNEFLDSESSTESQVYAGHLLTIISVILTVTAVVISIVGIAIYSGLQTHFRGKVIEVEDRLKSTFDELLGEAEIRSHKIVDKKERELHDFERCIRRDLIGNLLRIQDTGF